jgi:Mor family transcriptional regulator
VVKKIKEYSLAEDLIVSCAGEGVPTETAQKAIRALCRHFGGQMIYVPGKKENGVTADNLRGVLADATDDRSAEAILQKIMSLYGYMQMYIPFERRAFRKVIALEIFKQYGKNGKSMNDIAREYNISFTLAYRLWREGQRENVEKSLPFLPFLEFTDRQQ